MSDSTIAAVLLEGGDDADRMVSCCVCDGPAPLPNFIFESVKLWNRDEWALAERERRKANLIATSELGITCSIACNAKEFTRRHAESERDNETTCSYLAMLHAGKYNPESLAWLRSHGLARHVERVLAKEGTAKANG